METIMKIISFLIYNLKKNSLMEYTHVFIEKVETCPLLVAELATWLAALKDAFAEAWRIHQITLRSPITEEISMTDRQRDGLITGIKHIALSYEKSPEAEEREAAAKVLFGLSSIKLNLGDQYVEQTGQVDTLIEYFETREPAAIATLKLGEQVTVLKKVNARMHELIELRVQEVQDKELGAFERARKVLEEAYRQFVISVNSWALLNTARLHEGVTEEGQITPAEFIEWANANIEFYDRKVLNTPVGEVEEDVEHGDGEEETEEGGATRKPSCYWLNELGETMCVQQYEPGEKIVPPEPPTGYIWNYHPNYMPDHDLTITCLLDE